MKNFLKIATGTMALLLAGTSLSMALSVDELPAVAKTQDEAIIIVADDDDDRPNWSRSFGPRWQFYDDDDRDDDDRDDDDDDDDDD